MRRRARRAASRSRSRRPSASRLRSRLPPTRKAGGGDNTQASAARSAEEAVRQAAKVRSRWLRVVPASLITQFPHQTGSEEGSTPPPPQSSGASGEVREMPPQDAAHDSADANAEDHERDRKAEASRVRALLGRGARWRARLTIAAARVLICRTGATRSASSSATVCQPSTLACSASTVANERFICERHAIEWTH